MGGEEGRFSFTARRLRDCGTLLADRPAGYTSCLLFGTSCPEDLRRPNADKSLPRACQLPCSQRVSPVLAVFFSKAWLLLRGFVMCRRSALP